MNFYLDLLTPTLWSYCELWLFCMCIDTIILVAGALIETFVLKSYISYSLPSPPLVSWGAMVSSEVVLVTQSCPAPCEPMGHSLLLAPVSMGLAIQEYWSVCCLSLLQGSTWPRNRTWVSCIAGRFFTVWKPPGKPRSEVLTMKYYEFDSQFDHMLSI